MNLNLHKYHNPRTKNQWKQRGLLWTSQEEFEEIYQRYINSTQCELCGKYYISNYDRQMDHKHCIHNKWGWFRNVVCGKCNCMKYDRNQTNNTSGCINILKDYDKKCKQGFFWRFKVTINGKSKSIKTSINKEWLIDFATQWKIDNKYHT
tara:strand:+ start:91 stop:540 length:450 start_codon:yes stop_codon:yes gene_type:complete